MDYLLHEEGRVAYESTSFRYEYNIKDHLGNVRQVVRAPQTGGFMATMEMSAAEEEEVQFEQLPESRQGGAEHNVTPGGDRVAWLNASRGRVLGPARTQEVQRGDSIRLSVHGKYKDEQKGKANIGSFIATGAKDRLLTDLLEFGEAMTRSAEPNAITVFNIIDLLAKNLQQKDAPEAYMMYALYDTDSVLYAHGKQVLTKNAANRHEVLEEDLYISEDGYMEAFLVNETEEDVWFDDFSIQSTTSFIVQETHYDPWGLELTGLGFQAGGGVKVNRYLYNGNEIQTDLNFNLYDFKARYYDPVTGRFLSVDPLSADEKQVLFSPYQFGWNNPIRFNDPTGECPECEVERPNPFKGEVYRTTGGADYVYGKGAWTRHGGTLNEVTVTATQSDHERTMSNPVVRHMQASNARLASEIAPFTRHMVRSSIDAAGYTGAGISAVGTVVTPFVPHIGLGLLTVGGTVSSASGLASASMNFLEGSYGSAVIDAGMVGLGGAGPAGLKMLKNRQVINTTDEVVLWSIYNSSVDVLGIGIIPAVKK